VSCQLLPEFRCGPVAIHRNGKPFEGDKLFRQCAEFVAIGVLPGITTDRRMV
jgi:hypothetical protein